MKKTAAILAALLLAAAALCGAAYPSPTSDFFVNDYAGVLSSDTRAYIMEHSASLAQETGAQIVVLTVQSLDGEDPASYALNVGRQWGIGDKEKDNGLLLLLAPDDGEIRVEVGRGLEGALNDAKVGRMIDTYALESYKAGDFDAAEKAYAALDEAVHALFEEGNPVGVKCALSVMGRIGDTMRLPLVAGSGKLRAKFEELIARYDLR